MVISRVKTIAFQPITKVYESGHFILFVKISFIYMKQIHGCLEIPDLFLVLNMNLTLCAALTREIASST